MSHAPALTAMDRQFLHARTPSPAQKRDRPTSIRLLAQMQLAREASGRPLHIGAAVHGVVHDNGTPIYDAAERATGLPLGNRPITPDTRAWMTCWVGEDVVMPHLPVYVDDDEVDHYDDSPMSWPSLAALTPLPFIDTEDLL